MATGCDKPINIQLILLGESGVGKTSLLLRFVSGIFKESLQMTRIDYSTKIIKINNQEVNLIVWDTAGQEMYNSLIRSYYRIADGLLLVYDVQNAETFSPLSKWLIDFKSKNETAEVLIAGNKIEDQSKKLVTLSMVSSFARAEQMEHVGVSAKSGENVEILFYHLVKKILAARGIISHSTDTVLRELENTGVYVSPSTVIPEEAANSPENSQEHLQHSDRTSTNIAENAGICVEIAKNSLAEGIVPVPEANKLLDDRSSQDSGFSYFSCPDADAVSIADCALEFFDALGEDVTCVPQDHNDIIRLHEETSNSAVDHDGNDCCVIA